MAEESKRDVKLSPVGLHYAEHQRNVWVIESERGTSKEDIIKPSYWSNVAAKLRPWDRIEVRAEDGTYFAEYLVLSCDRTWAKVHMLRFEYLTSQDISMTEAEEIQKQYSIKFRGPKKWSIIRNIDRAVLHEGLHDEQSAKQWLDVYLRSQNIPVSA